MPGGAEITTARGGADAQGQATSGPCLAESARGSVYRRLVGAAEHAGIHHKPLICVGQAFQPDSAWRVAYWRDDQTRGQAESASSLTYPSRVRLESLTYSRVGIKPDLPRDKP